MAKTIESLPVAEHSAGIPQLDPSSYANQIFWLVLALLAVYWVVSRIGIPRVATILDQRQAAIEADIARAEDLRNAAEEARLSYEEALRDAHKKALEIVESTNEDIQSELRIMFEKSDVKIAERMAEAEKNINSIRTDALATIEKTANEAAALIVFALCGKAADKDAIATEVAKHLQG